MITINNIMGTIFSTIGDNRLLTNNLCFPFCNTIQICYKVQWLYSILFSYTRIRRRKNEINFTYNRKFNGQKLGSFTQFSKPQSKFDGLHYCLPRNNIGQHARSITSFNHPKWKKKIYHRICLVLGFLGLQQLIYLLVYLGHKKGGSQVFNNYTLE